MTNTVDHFIADFSDKQLTVYVSGEIDHHNARQIRESIDNLLYEKRPEMLCIDLSGITFMDSSGLGLILGRLSKAAEIGCGIKLADPSPYAEKILEIAGMERLIDIVRNEKNKQKNKNGGTQK